MRWFRTENGLVARQLGREDFQIKDYEETTVTLSNSGAQNLTGTILFVRVGRLVTYTSDGVLSHNSGGTITSDTNEVPQNFLPTSLHNTCYSYSNFGQNCRVLTNGAIQLVYRDENGVAVVEPDTGIAINGSYVIL